VDKLGKTPETMGIDLGISCVDRSVLPVDIPIYQGFWGYPPVCKKYLPTIFGKFKAEAFSRFRFKCLDCGE
jgi:hypothetical protein